MVAAAASRSTTLAGVPAGAEQAVPHRHLVARQAGFAHGRNIRRKRGARLARHRDGLELAGLDVRHGGRGGSEHGVGPAPQHVGNAFRRAFVEHGRDLDVGLFAKHLDREMVGGSRAGRGEVQFTRMALRIGDQLLQIRHRQRRRHRQDEGTRGDHRDRRKILDHVERQFLEQAHVHRVRVGGQQQRVAVFRRARGRLRRDVGRRARPVFDDERFAQSRAQAVADQPCRQVGEGAGRHADDDLHRLARIGLLRRRGADT